MRAMPVPTALLRLQDRRLSVVTFVQLRPRYDSALTVRKRLIRKSRSPTNHV